MPLILYFFSACNLAIGSSAFMLGSIVIEVAQGLGVSPATAGQATTAYALATALLAPVMLIVTTRWPRRWALVAALALFAGGGFISALAPSVFWLYTGRILMGIGAVFTPMCAGIAVASVEPAARGKALSLVFLGMSLSYVVGIPLGTWLASHFGWRLAMGAFASLVAIFCLLSAFVVPAKLTLPATNLKGTGRLLLKPEVLKVLALTLLYFTAIFSAFSYIGPVLKSLQSLSPSELSLTLTLFGIAGVIGTVSGGYASDRFGVQRTLTFQLSTMAVMMVLLPLTKGHYWFMMGVLFFWGIAGFGMMAPQQSRLAEVDPVQAPLLLSLNTSMLYLGTALGAVMGGLVGEAFGFDKIAWIASLFAFAGLALLIFTRKR